MSITIIGTVALDSIESPHGKYERILGGSATYAATAARLFSTQAINIVSIIGPDFPDNHHRHFEVHQINTDGLIIGQANTFHWQGKYEGDMSQALTLATDLNVLLEFDPIIPAHHQDSRFVFCANFDPTLQQKAIAQFKNPDLVILDTMNYWIETQKEALKTTLKMVDVLIINDQEIKQLSGENNLIRALSTVLTMGPSRIIVKKGEHGAIMATPSSYFLTPAFPLTEVVDPTGAGDSFAGGLIGFLSATHQLDDTTFRKAMIAGTLISSFTVQGFSLDQLKTISKESLTHRYRLFQSYIATEPLFGC